MQVFLLPTVTLPRGKLSRINKDLQDLRQVNTPEFGISSYLHSCSSCFDFQITRRGAIPSVMLSESIAPA